MQKKLFIISNRLPVNVETVNNQSKINISSGGLITAISSYINYATEKEENRFSEYFWIGAPCCSQSQWVEAKRGIGESEYEYLPVFVNHKIYDLYYNGLANSVIWPLFHYFPSYAEYKIEYFENYIKANLDFLDVVIRNVKEGDTVWIHDYHLLPLAGMIRKHFTNVTIGFFLHIPFPSYELFRVMPDKWQREMLEGVLGADLIGFHTIDYAMHFLKCLQIVLGIEVDNTIVKYKNRLVKIDVFPISIDFGKYNSAYNYKEVASLRNFYKEQFKGKKIIFSVDRLDYTKGVFSRLKAYEWFLNLFPQYKERVVFIIVIVPSRDTIPKYAERKKEIDEFIGNLNSSTGTITWKPIIYQYNHLAFAELSALYTVCNMALITPLRDGMNLVAKEFIASRKDLKGVLLLSEMTGAAKEFTDALLINPNDLEGLAHKIKEGLEMSEEEQSRRLMLMQKRIIQFDVNAWAEDFFTQLDSIKIKQKEFEFMFLDRDSKQLLYEKYYEATKRLLLLDYDGTLVSFSPTPEQSQPDETLLALLKDLCKSTQNSVFIISGRDSNTLDKWLGHLRVNLVAEHGAKIKYADSGWKVDNHIHTDENWKEIVYEVMERYVKRCPNTFVEQKEFSIVWHFRNSEPEQAKVRANELYTELCRLTQNLNVQVVRGNKIIEARIKGIDKGYMVKKLLKEHEYDFILACGDDNTDEDMFKILANNKKAFTIKIGDEASYAMYNLYTPQMTISLLQYFQNSFA
jgi:trehalose 6-phosphate synthase/phosphatase